MTPLTPDEATAQARAALGIDTKVAVQVWPVRRLDRHGEVYYLIVFGAADASVAVATVIATSGEVSTWAYLPGLEPHVRVDERQALELAGLKNAAQADLVWQPCRISRSPLYPLWEVRMGGKTIYVDQHRSIWQQLGVTGPGG